MGEVREMPRYKCHKEVHALKIERIEFPARDADQEDDGRRLIVPADEGFAPFMVSHDFIRRHGPKAGGYYVVYEDGYTSYSPAGPFEKGYTRLDTEHDHDREPSTEETESRTRAVAAAHDADAARVLLDEHGEEFQHRPTAVRAVEAERDYHIETDHGILTVKAGTWMITDLSGEIWPLRDSKFKEKYRPVSG